MNYLLFSFLKTLYFCYNSMVFLSIYNILYTIGKLWFPSFQWDCCQSEILTYFLSSQLSVQISYLSPVQLVLFKILEYSRQCKIPHSKIPNSTCCITQDRQSGIVFCHSWPTPIFIYRWKGIPDLYLMGLFSWWETTITNFYGRTTLISPMGLLFGHYSFWSSAWP